MTQVKSSPWGKVQRQEEDDEFPGIIWVSTAGHGGCKIPLKEYGQYISEETLRKFSTERNSASAWFEEDWAYCVPMYEIKYQKNKLNDVSDQIKAIEQITAYALNYSKEIGKLNERFDELLNYNSNPTLITELSKELTDKIDKIKLRLASNVKRAESEKKPDYVSSRLSCSITKAYDEIAYLNKIRTTEVTGELKDPTDIFEKMLEQDYGLKESDYYTFKKILDSHEMHLAWTKDGKIYLVGEDSDYSKKFLITDYTQKIRIG